MTSWAVVAYKTGEVVTTGVEEARSLMRVASTEKATVIGAAGEASVSSFEAFADTIKTCWATLRTLVVGRAMAHAGHTFVG